MHTNAAAHRADLPLVPASARARAWRAQAGFASAGVVAVITALAACGNTTGPPPTTPGPAPTATGSGAPAAAPASDAQRSAADSAPTPYTAAQIRDASRAGRTYVYRVEGPDAPPRTTTITFVEVTPQGTTTRSTTVDEKSGAPVQPEKTSRATWEELRRHAEFPRDATTITDETTTVPAGTFDCKVYTVVEKKDATAPHMRFYFAKTMPGAPVLITIDKDGARVRTQTLLSHRAGA